MIRLGRDDDGSGLIALIGACWAEYPSIIFDVDAELPELYAFASYLHGRGGALWVAEAGGTGRRADFGAARGKTGTTNAFRDAWFVGYAGPTVAGVWLGNDDDRAMAHVEGGGLPAELFRSYLARYAKAMAPPRPAVAKVAAGW